MTNSIHEVYAYLCVPSVAEAMTFYAKAFGATEHFRLTEPSGRVGHAEMYLGNSIVMLSDEFPEMDVRAPRDGDAPMSLHLHVDDADAMFAAAVEAGAVSERAPEDQFYGERSATVRDPFGYRWMLGHSIEEVNVDEMQRRYDSLFAE